MAATIAGTKYAVMLVDVTADDAVGEELVANDVRTWRGQLSDLVDPAEVAHWKEWLGTLAWREIEREHRLVVTHMPSDRPDVTDAENGVLEDRLQRAWHALVLADPLRPLSGRPWFASGEAESIRPLKLRSVRRTGYFEHLAQPFYDRREPFGNTVPWQQADFWLDRWKHTLAMLDAALPTAPEIIHVALLAFMNGLVQVPLEFRIPDLVRTAECVLAVPKHNGGAPKFATRALQIAGRLHLHWYVGGCDLEDRIKALYQHRSDCVHGKVPFSALKSRGDPGADEAAAFEYLAEALARACLLRALAQPADFQFFASRDTIEAAWEAGTFP